MTKLFAQFSKNLKRNYMVKNYDFKAPNYDLITISYRAISQNTEKICSSLIRKLHGEYPI